LQNNISGFIDSSEVYTLSQREYEKLRAAVEAGTRERKTATIARDWSGEKETTSTTQVTYNASD
jgi:hypothetical protein